MEVTLALLQTVDRPKLDTISGHLKQTKDGVKYLVVADQDEIIQKILNRTDK